MASIRSRIDSELARRVGSWFTVREIQDKLRVHPSTLKPLIMKYARERVLRRRRISGTARSVEFSPNADTPASFGRLVVRNTPYRVFHRKRSAASGKSVGVSRGRGR